MVSPDLRRSGFADSNPSWLDVLDIAGAFLGTCFAAGTPIRTPDGSKPIEQLKVGDWVLAAPENDPGGIPGTPYLIASLRLKNCVWCPRISRISRKRPPAYRALRNAFSSGGECLASDAIS